MSLHGTSLDLATGITLICFRISNSAVSGLVSSDQPSGVATTVAVARSVAQWPAALSIRGYADAARFESRLYHRRKAGNSPAVFVAAILAAQHTPIAIQPIGKNVTLLNRRRPPSSATF
jgi:hypothetical protein